MIPLPVTSLTGVFERVWERIQRFLLLLLSAIHLAPKLWMEGACLHSSENAEICKFCKIFVTYEEIIRVESSFDL